MAASGLSQANYPYTVVIQQDIAPQIQALIGRIPRPQLKLQPAGVPGQFQNRRGTAGKLIFMLMRHISEPGFSAPMLPV